MFFCIIVVYSLFIKGLFTPSMCVHHWPHTRKQLTYEVFTLQTAPLCYLKLLFAIDYIRLDETY